MQGFKSVGSAQRFLSTHAATYNTYNVQRHLTSARTHRAFRASAMQAWREVIAAAHQSLINRRLGASASCTAQTILLSPLPRNERARPSCLTTDMRITTDSADSTSFRMDTKNSLIADTSRFQHERGSIILGPNKVLPVRMVRPLKPATQTPFSQSLAGLNVRIQCLQVQSVMTPP
jgi:hypothetical protein